MQIENTSITISADELDKIINVAVEEIAKHVDICNENGHFVMKVKDGENITIHGNDCYIHSEKDFCDPIVGIHIKNILITNDPDSGAIKQCTIPTGMSVTSNADDHCGINLQFGQPHPLIHCNGFFGSVPNVTTDGFCRLVQEKINDMQTGANVNQNNNTNTISTNTDNSMDDKTIDQVLEYINGNVSSDVQSGHGDNKNQGKKKKKKKTNKKNKKGNKAKQTGEQNINQAEDQKEEPKIVEKHEDQKEDQKEEPKVEEKSTNNTAPKENLISATEEQLTQIIEEQPHQIEQQQNIGGQPQIEQQPQIEPLLNIEGQQNDGGHQNAGTHENRPNYIVKHGYGNTRNFYNNGHCLQMAGQYYTNNWQLNREQMHQHAGPAGQTPLPVPHPANSWKGYYTQHDQQNQTRLNLKAKPFHPKGK